MDYKKKYLKYKLKYLNARKTLRGGMFSLEDTFNSIGNTFNSIGNTVNSLTMSSEEKERIAKEEEERQAKEENFFELINEEMKTEENKCGLHAFLEAKTGQFAVDDELGGTLLDKGMSRLENIKNDLKNFTEGKTCNAIELNISESPHHQADKKIYQKYTGTIWPYTSSFNDYLWKQ